jgi:hypothetical protein
MFQREHEINLHKELATSNKIASINIGSGTKPHTLATHISHVMTQQVLNKTTKFLSSLCNPSNTM